MSTRVTFLGVAGYDVQGPHHRILIDPFLSQSPRAPIGPDDVSTPDVILVSHAAYDHYGDAAAIAKRTGAPVVCGGDVQAMLMDEGVPEAQIRATVWGVVVEVGGVVVRPVECHHWSRGHLSGGAYVNGVPMGFVVETEPGIRLYHYGDTALFGDLRLIGELYQPTIGLMGCTQPLELLDRDRGAGRVLTGEMSPDEAARAAEMLGLKIAVACHYYDETQPDVVQFLQLVAQHDTSGQRRAIAPAVGETLVFEASSAATAGISVQRSTPR